MRSLSPRSVRKVPGQRYLLTQYMHVMLAHGFSDDGVRLTDPGTAVWREYSWLKLMAMWSVMVGMGLSIAG